MIDRLKTAADAIITIMKQAGRESLSFPTSFILEEAKEPEPGLEFVQGDDTLYRFCEFRLDEGQLITKLQPGSVIRGRCFYQMPSNVWYPLTDLIWLENIDTETLVKAVEAKLSDEIQR